MWIWWLVPFARQRPVPQRDNRQAVFGRTKSDCARPPSVFARFSTCWLLLFPPLSEVPREGAPLWLDFRHPDSRDKYIKHHCKRRLLQMHPEAVWPCKSVCTVTGDLCRKLNNKSVIFYTQILFIMPVLQLSRRTVYVSSLAGTSRSLHINSVLFLVVTQHTGHKFCCGTLHDSILGKNRWRIAYYP